ncbi:FAD-binding oxidoreductase [Nocardioides sp. GCM10028917]|uniref:FAD-binding oxidoreductase n=1 Tax=Nocardioides sp. GCM10028917 TaxID=3273408 RepID=UPI0036098769
MTGHPQRQRDARGARRFTGWGRTSPSVATWLPASSVDDVRAAIKGAGGRGVLARGLGRSYGDAAQNAGGVVVDLTGLDRVLSVDPEDPGVVVEAGVSLDALMRTVLPFGLWVPVLPGTRHVTVGGAIASDVHGKNHHRSGSFGHHVRAIWLVTADGEEHRLTPADPLFWATIGGMGLTGVITRAHLRLTRTETAWFTVDTDRTHDLDATMGLLEDGDAAYPYTVAWFDAAGSRTAGRGVVYRARPALPDELPARERTRPLILPSARVARIPDVLPSGIVTPATARAFSEMWFRKAPRHRTGEVQDASAFFHPLDGIDGWNRLYGPAGFCQHQFVVPASAAAAIHECVGLIRSSGHVSFLNVLKRLGPGNDGLLSFPMRGWTMSVDLPARDGLDNLLDALDAVVLGAGGRLYLAKDARTTAATLAAGYPRLDEFRRIRRDVDPTGVFSSDLARRLDL